MGSNLIVMKKEYNSIEYLYAFSEHEKDNIMGDYLFGSLSLKKIAKKHNVSPSTMGRFINNRMMKKYKK